MKRQGFRVARKYRYYSRPYVGILVDIPPSVSSGCSSCFFLTASVHLHAPGRTVSATWMAQGTDICWRVGMEEDEGLVREARRC